MNQTNNKDISDTNKETASIKENLKKLNKLNIEDLSKINFNKESIDIKTDNKRQYEILNKHNMAIEEYFFLLPKILIELKHIQGKICFEYLVLILRQ